MTMLAVEEMRAGYGSADVLHGISVEVAEGELVTILGANGAGKTTFLRVISSLTPLRDGRVVFRDEEISGAEADEICRRGLIQVPEGRRLFPRMTVEENLELGAMPGEPRRRRSETQAEVFDRFPVLGERRDQLAGTLSGGEQQQLALGRALMGLPKMLLLDEPTLGLAPVLTEDVLDTVRMLHREGLTILLVSQEVVSALEIAERAYVFENGEVTITGAADELIERDDIREAYLGM